VTLPTATPPAADTGQQEPPFPPAPIEVLLQLFVKAVRAHQLYLPNNPVYKGAIDAARAAFAPIWQHTEDFSLRFTETEMRWYGRPVLTESTKSGDSLPWTFFKDGVREVTITRGFEDDELVKLFEILQRVRKATPEEDDLLTMLWEADFEFLRYRYVDLAVESAPPPEDGGARPPTVSPDQVQSAVHQQPEESLPGLINIQDFDATLYFLDEKELDHLRHEIEREYAGDLRQNVISILFDIYETQTAPEIREEISELVENLMLLLLSANRFSNVAYVLTESQMVVQRGTAITDAQRERVGRLPDRLSAPQPLSQLLQGLDESADLPSQAELTELFQRLQPGALGTIFTWLPRLQNQRVRELVQQAADRLASGNTGELVSLIGASDRTVAMEAIRRSGALKTPAAVTPIAKVLAGDDAELRQAAVAALSEIGSGGALQALERAVDDADRDVRVAAVRALGARSHRGVLTRLETTVKGKAIREADLTEKMAFFEAFGAMCGDAAVPFLDGLLNGKTMFGRREDPELRACAAMALGRVASKKAQDSLQRAAGEKDIVVRNAVNRALRTGGPGTGTTG
jgi:hypothetical protein